MRTRRKIAEGRRCNRGITRGRHIVLCSPGARIQLVMEGVVIRARKVCQHLELHIRRGRQVEIDLHLTGRGIGRRGKILGSIVRPLDRLTARSRRIVHHHKRGKQTLAREAFQFHDQAGAAARARGRTRTAG